MDLESTNQPNKGPKRLGPKDDLFKQEILLRSGLETAFGFPSATPHSVFGNLTRPIESQVFLNLDNQQLLDIARDIRIFHERCLDESSLAFILTDCLLRRDRFVHQGHPETKISSLRRDKWRFQKEGPRDFQDRYYTYDWDIEPDITYMASVNMFNPSQRRKVYTDSFLNAELFGICPYLTIGFRSAKGWREHDSVNQVTAATLIWLHQRQRIRKQSGSIDYRVLKHYAFTFISTRVGVWQVSCTADGYLRRELDSCSLLTPEGLESFVQWNNAIHAWGLGLNAMTFKEDAENYFKGNEP